MDQELKILNHLKRGPIGKKTKNKTVALYMLKVRRPHSIRNHTFLLWLEINRNYKV